MRLRLVLGIALASLGGCSQDEGGDPSTWAMDDNHLGQSDFKIVEFCPPQEFLDMGLPDGSVDSGASGCNADAGTGTTPTCVNTTSTDVCSGALPPSQGGCWVTGGGFIVDADGNDNYGGNAMPMKDGTIRGEWEHVDHGTGDKSHGEARYIVCRHVDEPGPGQPSGPSHNFNINQVYFGGPARWSTPAAGWQDGYWFDVFAEDHGEPGNKPGPGNHGSMGPDYYHFTIRKMVGQNQSGEVVYDTQGDIVGGNIQIHPPNNGHPYTAGTLPMWVSYQP
jgi:hypothetical protein